MSRLHAFVSVAIPIVGSLVAFVLVLVALQAGTSPGMMEEYNIITFNTSELGKNLIPTKTGGSSSSTTTGGLCNDLGVLGLGSACSSVASAASSVESDVLSALDGLEDDIADKLSAKLGLHQFYSVHVKSVCEGYFTPNATAPNAGLNITSCSNSSKADFNITALFDHDLKLGPLDLNVAKLGFTQDLQDELDKIPKLLNVLADLFYITAALTGLSWLMALVTGALVPRYARLLTFINLGVSFLALVFVVTCATVLHVSAKSIADLVNKYGVDFGLAAVYGQKFANLLWAALALMAVVWIFWVVTTFRWCVGKRLLGDDGRRWSGRFRSDKDSEVAIVPGTMFIPGMHQKSSAAKWGWGR